MVLPSFDGISLKLQRAYNQIDSLKQEMSVFLDGDAYEPAFEFRRLRGAFEAPHIVHVTVRMVVKETCPPVWGIVIGEIVHNLRSALDHVVYQLVVHATGSPPPDGSRTQFPISDAAPKFKRNSVTMLEGVSNKAAALIESMQSFSTGEDKRSPLLHINELSNFDKHRTIHLTGGTLEAFNIEFPPLVNPARIDRHVRQQGAFQNNTIIAEATLYSSLPPFGEPLQVEMKAKIHFNIVFDQRTPVVGEWAVINTLLDMADRARDCIARMCKDVLLIDFVL